MNNSKFSPTSFTKPTTYTSQINDLHESQDLLLDEFRKVYVISHMHPDNQEYQQQFANASSHLDQVQSKLFSLDNELQGNVETLNASLFELNTLIDKERKKNADLKRNMRRVENQHTSANEMISEYKEYYNMNYLRNWGLLLSTVLCIYAITVIREPAKTAERVAQNKFEQTALLSLIVNTLLFIPCLIGDILMLVGKALTMVVNALLYIPSLVFGKVE
jgi:hypothetical protein